MQEASLVNFVRTLCYIVAFYYIFKFLAKLLLPLLIKKVVEKASENFQQQGQYSFQKTWSTGETKKEGEVTIDTTNVKNKPQSNNVGDYVDYEEIE